jgi:hypothetical protein
VPREAEPDWRWSWVKDQLVRLDDMVDALETSLIEVDVPTGLARWPLHEFKSPKRTASAVWPLSAVLAPPIAAAAVTVLPSLAQLRKLLA